MGIKEKFYVFLDIDGVLWDWDWRKKQIAENKINNKASILELNPESISALNFLLCKLNAYFDCRLVISSTWKKDMPKTEFILRKNGLKFNKRILFTPSNSQAERGNEILEFLTNSKAKNFVILDDELADLKYFPRKNIIKTDISNHSLKKSDAIQWLKSYFQNNILEMNL